MYHFLNLLILLQVLQHGYSRTLQATRRAPARTELEGDKAVLTQLGLLRTDMNDFMKRLEKQSTEAIIAARSKIVHGAVSMVEMALKGLSERDIVHLDDERRAAMVSNLLVVLCSEGEAQPVINTGTLYQ